MLKMYQHSQLYRGLTGKLAQSMTFPSVSGSIWKQYLFAPDMQEKMQINH
jgi:hypothetical protein